jgi:hypothetical protein
MFTFVKVIVSAVIIGIVTELARRFPTYGGIVAALPLVSLLSLFWLYVQGEQIQNLNKFALGVLYGFPATAVLLVIVTLALKHAVPIFLSLGLGISGWFLFLAIQGMVVRFFSS